MSNETTRIFMPEGNNDALTAAMMNGGMNGGMWNNPIWAIVFLAALRNGGIFGDGNGNGGRCQLSQIQEQLQTIQGNNSLMSAIQGGTNEIRSLANTINCDVNAVQSAINGVQASICNVGNQVGMSSAQVINSIQNGNMSLANTLQNCCCDVKQLVTTQGYENRISNLQQSQLIQNGFAQIGYASADQTCQLKQNNNDNTNRVLAKLDAIEDSRKDREIASLNAALTAANSRAERQTELAPIYKALSDIECKQPKTESVYAPSVVGVPACVAAQYQLGLYGGFPYAQQRGNVFS
ncbi:MAG: hypothetical protein KBT27_11445 [Prevotellaceae bacterium]|nr:hypothetical protein [Candidatus Faecinaster equi]